MANSICGAGAESSIDNSGCCSIPQPNPDYVALKNEMQEHFTRNLMPNAHLPRSATVKFFLTPEGQIRNAYILKSSGNKNGDLACIDAVYAASPLRKPPDNVGPLLPPPGTLFLPPTQFGSHNYTFEFKAPIKTGNGICQYPVVPLEILYRYPGLFDEKYILSKENLLDFKTSRIDLEVIEFSRFSWEKFYRDKAKATREEVLDWAKQIRHFHLQTRPKVISWAREQRKKIRQMIRKGITPTALGENEN